MGVLFNDYYRIVYLMLDSHGPTYTSDLEPEDANKTKNEHRRPVLLWVDLYYHLYYPSCPAWRVSERRPGAIMASHVGNN